jgi:hypothetical protein
VYLIFFEETSVLLIAPEFSNEHSASHLICSQLLRIKFTPSTSPNTFLCLFFS